MDKFFNNLVGSWNLTGKMGSTELRQNVEACWVLQGHFLQMHCLQADNPVPGQPPYEALYLLGFDENRGEYSFHLFDTFGAGYAATVGFGVRRGDSLEFLFDYPDGPFSNSFTWKAKTGEWEMLLRQQDEAGGWREFATKRLSRA